MGILKNVRLYLGEYDLTTAFNQVEVRDETEAKDDTRFSASGDARIYIPGLAQASVNGQFYAATNAVDGAYGSDDIVAAKFATENVPLSILPDGGDVGDRAALLRAVTASYDQSLVVGEQRIGKLTARSQGVPLIRGQVLETGAKVATGTGSAIQLGAVTATQAVYGALHVLAISGGGTFTMTVQSDDNAGFTSGTSRLSFAAKTAIGSEWLSAAGAITDTYWRASWTLTAGSVTFVLVVGIR